MPGNRIELSIDQDRNIKAECLNAICKLKNLLLAMLTGVSRIRRHFVDRSVDDFEALLATYTAIRCFTHYKNPKVSGDSAESFVRIFHGGLSNVV